MPPQLSLDETAAPLIPERPSLPKLKEAAAGCTACPLHETGTQTVFGEGTSKAEVVFVGEQPGDQEDLQGKPFVGPAGKLLDKALEDAGIDRSQVYVTNVVKHFKWQARGKRRIHQKPNWSEIAACRPWLEAELEVIEPLVLAACRSSRTSPSTSSRRRTRAPSSARTRRPASASTGSSSATSRRWQS